MFHRGADGGEMNITGPGSRSSEIVFTPKAFDTKAQGRAAPPWESLKRFGRNAKGVPSDDRKLCFPGVRCATPGKHTLSHNAFGVEIRGSPSKLPHRICHIMRLAILAGGDGWHVRDLRRAAGEFGHSAKLLDFRRLAAGVGTHPNPLAGFDAVIVRTMPPGSLEQVVFRMDLLHRARAAGITILNPPAALEACVDKYLATAKLAAAGLAVPRDHRLPNRRCRHWKHSNLSAATWS